MVNSGKCIMATKKEIENLIAAKHLCTLRRDLFESGLGAPVGNDNEFIIDDKRYKYRWLGDQFQVKFEGIWENAYSIDFDFD